MRAGIPVGDRGEAVLPLVTEPEEPSDIRIRPDGTPGSLSAYAPKPRVVPYVFREPPIMLALATLPKLFRMVNSPEGKTPDPDAGRDSATDPLIARYDWSETRGPLDLKERIFTGDGLARFASARFDPDAPMPVLRFDDEDSIVELEMISTGGDPEAEAERAAMIAAHPEGKPIVTFRHGTRSPLTVDREGPTAGGPNSVAISHDPTSNGAAPDLSNSDGQMSGGPMSGGPTSDGLPSDGRTPDGPGATEGRPRDP